MRKHVCLERASLLNHTAIFEFERWVITKKGYTKSVYIHSLSWWCIWKGTCIIWRKNKEEKMQKSFGYQSFFPLCGSLAWAALPVSGSCTLRPKSLSSSGRFLCPVAVRVQLKLLSLSELSSAELVPSAIPSERATQQPVFRRIMHNGPTWYIGLA